MLLFIELSSFYLGDSRGQVRNDGITVILTRVKPGGWQIQSL